MKNYLMALLVLFGASFCKKTTVPSESSKPEHHEEPGDHDDDKDDDKDDSDKDDK